jgi:hypothetical protein
MFLSITKNQVANYAKVGSQPQREDYVFQILLDTVIVSSISKSPQPSRLGLTRKKQVVGKPPRRALRSTMANGGDSCPLGAACASPDLSLRIGLAL